MFGFGNEPGWDLEYINKTTTPDEYEYGQAFLSPTGPLLKLVYRLQADPYLTYEFPLRCLPAPTQRLIEEGAIPGFYANKLQLQAFGRPYLSLNPFELYLFHFSYMLVSRKSRQNTPVWGHFAAYLYPTLVEDYLDYFLPLDQQPPPMPPLPSPVRSMVVHPQSKISIPQSSGSPGMPKYVSSGLHLLKPSVIMAQKQHFQSPSVLDQSGTETWRSETLIQVFSDFWLNQNSQNANPPGIVHHSEEIYVPTINHIRMIRLLVKHLHYFVNSASAPILTSPYYQQTLTPLDQFKKTTVLGIVQKRLYTFLRHAFDWWPLDSSFRLLLETWLSYIQPWRYVGNNKNTLFRGDVDDDTKIGGSHERWYNFVVDNLLFYTAIFHQTLPRLFRMDMTSPHNAYMLFRITKVFCNPSLNNMLHRAEHEMCQPSLLPAGTGRDLSGSYLASDHKMNAALNLQISELERPGFQYVPLFERYTVDMIRKLLINVNQAKNEVIEAERTEKPSQFKLPSVWSKIVNFFSVDPPTNDVNGAELNYKTRQHLECVENNLQTIFQVSTPEVLLSSSIYNNDPTDFVQPKNTSSKYNSPEMKDTSEGWKLTDMGRYQLVNNLRKSDVKYQGDPELQPIRTYENAFLVRILYGVCCHINTQCALTINRLYYRQDFLGRLSRVYLCPPFRFRDFQSPNRLRITSTSTSPHLSLRFLASYPTLFHLLLLYLILYFSYGFGLPSYLFTLFVITISYGLLQAVFTSNTVNPVAMETTRLSSLSPSIMDSLDEDLSFSFNASTPRRVT